MGPEAHKRMKKLIKVGLFIIAIQGVIYLYLSYKHMSDSAVVLPRTQEALEKANEILAKRQANPTATWQTYRNEEYGFELKYPVNWEINQEHKTSSVIYLNPDKDNEFIVFNVDIKENPDNLPIKEWAKPLDNYWYLNWEEGFMGTYDEKNITIDNKSALWVNAGGEGGWNIHTIIPIDKKLIFVTLGSDIHDEYSMEKGEYNQVLATFKFISEKDGQICIQVITPARNPDTGEVREFPTPCDIPEGWIIDRDSSL